MSKDVYNRQLEMSQNSMRLSWTFEEVDSKLHDIMVGIHKNAYDNAKKFGLSLIHI